MKPAGSIPCPFAQRSAGYLCASLAAVGYAPACFAHDYPTKPIRLVISYPPGGGNDTLGLIVGQQAFVDNKAGKGGNLGTEQVAATTPHRMLVRPSLHDAQAWIAGQARNDNSVKLQDRLRHLKVMYRPVGLN